VFYQRNLICREFFQLTRWQQVDTSDKGYFDVGIDPGNNHLQEMHKGTEFRFQCEFPYTIPCWITDPVRYIFKLGIFEGVL